MFLFESKSKFFGNFINFKDNVCSRHISTLYHFNLMILIFHTTSNCNTNTCTTFLTGYTKVNLCDQTYFSLRVGLGTRLGTRLDIISLTTSAVHPKTLFPFSVPKLKQANDQNRTCVINKTFNKHNTSLIEVTNCLTKLL